MNRSLRTFINQLFALILPTLAAAGLVASGLTAHGADSSQTLRHAFESSVAPGQVVHVDSLLEVGGDLKVTEQGKIKPLKMSVVGKMTYDEKCLAIQQDKNHYQSVRSYKVAEATIKIEKGSASAAHYRDTRARLIGVSRGIGADVQLFSPRGSTVLATSWIWINIPASTHCCSITY